MRITVFSYDTLNCSVSANPRFKLYTDEGWFKTSSDCAFVYGLWDGWKREHNETGRVAEVELTRANRIKDLKWID